MTTHGWKSAAVRAPAVMQGALPAQQLGAARFCGAAQPQQHSKPAAPEGAMANSASPLSTRDAGVAE